jgi:hypothetical protein
MDPSHTDSPDTLLMHRAEAPAPRAGFAHDIIAAAARTPQRKPATLAEWIGGLFADFLPHPAYAAACVLAIGLMLGLGSPAGNSNVTAASAGYLQDAFTTQEEAAL